MALAITTKEEIWNELRDGLTKIYKFDKDINFQRPVSTKEFMHLYNHVYNFCTGQVKVTANRPIIGQEFNGYDLYERLKKFIRDFVSEYFVTCKDLEASQLLEKYTTFWKQFKFSSKFANDIFAHLNRHWISRELDEGNQDVYEIFNLAIVTWKTIFFDTLHQNITAAILKLIEQDRNGEKIQISLIGDAISSYLELGINKHDYHANLILKAHRPIADLTIYQNHFEKHFLEDTRRYYTTESTEFIQNNSFTEYLKKIELRFQEECDRCTNYFHESTQDHLLKILDDVLIKPHTELVLSEFESLLNHQNGEGLARIFSLFERMEELKMFRRMLDQDTEKMLRETTDKFASPDMNDPKQYVNYIRDVHHHFSTLVADPFKSSAFFVHAKESMDKAFASFINRNQVIEESKSLSKAPELLARYCDLLLRKSAKNSEEMELEDLLNQVMDVFEYIEDKDVFINYYSKLLAKRLINELSVSDEAESNMIGKLQQMCGYTSNLQRMFTDAGLSKNITENYRQYIVGRPTEQHVNFSIMVLTSGVWPAQQNFICQIPKSLSLCMDSFTNFYMKQHNGRKLAWLLHMCHGEVTDTGLNTKNARKYTFMASTAQITVLMLFNEATEYTLAQICEHVELKKEQIMPYLQPIVKVGLVKVVGSYSDLDDNVPDETKFVLNTEFQNKKMKLDLTKIRIHNEAKKDVEEVQRSVVDDRRHVIQAAIVRIMKTRKTLKHNQLMTEVLQQLSTLFQPQVPMIKKCIDLLIEKEYIKRVENDKDTYEYIS
uniref:Cullin family profile domain-containing protein n=1 Tax=Acrobeloides nanus TaxID=290746 RepID=A0A914CJC0_9BILA